MSIALSNGFKSPSLSIGSSLWAQLKELTSGWLLAVPKHRRPKRLIKHRHSVQTQQFMGKYKLSPLQGDDENDGNEGEREKRDKGYKRCEYCGSYKLGAHMCLFCFEYIRKAVNRISKF